MLGAGVNAERCLLTPRRGPSGLERSPRGQISVEPGQEGVRIPFAFLEDGTDKSILAWPLEVWAWVSACLNKAAPAGVEWGATDFMLGPHRRAQVSVHLLRPTAQEPSSLVDRSTGLWLTGEK